jgi:CBS domain-containing protein
MSGNYSMILPLGLCAAVGALSSRWLSRTSIYTERIRRRGLDLDAIIEESALHAIRVEDVLRRDVAVVPPETPVRMLLDRFLDANRFLVHVVDSEGKYHGLVVLQDVVAATEDSSLQDVLVAYDMTRQVPAVMPRDPVARVMERFWFQEYGELPVLSEPSGGRFIGIISRRDVLGAFDREVLRRKLLTARYRQRGEPIPEPQLPLLAAYGIEEIPVPAAFVGQSLIELDLPRKFQLNALAIHRPGKERVEELIPPPADLKLDAGDRLVLLGLKENLAKFRQS